MVLKLGDKPEYEVDVVQGSVVYFITHVTKEINIIDIPDIDVGKFKEIAVKVYEYAKDLIEKEVKK